MENTMTQQHQIIDVPAAWKSEHLYQNKQEWQYTLDKTDIHEIDEALKHLKSCELDSYKAYQSDFPLYKLKNKLKSIADKVENGLGIFLLRGIPVEKYSSAEIKLIYAGLGSYLGQLVAQSKNGELIGDVGDTGKKLKDKTGRGTTTKDAIPFHTDRCDIVTLLCLNKAEQGGESRVVSSIAIHNEIARTRPDLLKELYKPYHHARVAWETEKENDFYPLPIFSTYKGFFAARYLRHFVNIAQDIPAVPKMSEKQIEALDLIEKLADSSELCADMAFEPGDIQIINNFVSLHSRAGYTDTDEQGKKRHLLRLWVSATNSRPLNPSFEPLYGKTEAGAIRGGVPTKLLQGA
jgi:hypothetical protein